MAEPTRAASKKGAEQIEDLLQRRTDLSTFLVHLTRDDEEGMTAEEAFLSIVRSEQLIAGKTGLGPAREHWRLANYGRPQRAVCFTETPLEHIWMMLREISGRRIQFGPYGIVITKTTGRLRGCNPVWYTDISTRGRDWAITSVNRIIEAAVKAHTDENGKIDYQALAEEEIFAITPYFEQMGPTGEKRKEFWWEREWRHVGDMPLTASDIVALLAPEERHKTLSRKIAKEFKNAICEPPPMLDPRWGLERMIVALAGMPAAAVGPFPDPQ